MTTTARRTDVTLEDRYVAPSGPILISGIQALVRLALDQRRLDQRRGHDTGVFISGYPGSPLGGLDLELRRVSDLLDRAGVVFAPGVNEELAATAVGGTQLLGEVPGRRKQGVTGFWYGKNPGLDRAADAIRHSNLSGTAAARRRRRVDRGRPRKQVLDGAQLLRAALSQHGRPDPGPRQHR